VAIHTGLTKTSWFVTQKDHHFLNNVTTKYPFLLQGKSINACKMHEEQA